MIWNRFGWLVFGVGGLMLFYGAFIGKEVYLGGRFGGFQKVIDLPFIIVGSVVMVVGVLIALFKKNNIHLESSSFEKELSNDSYRVYLVKKHNIEKNEALNKFFCKDKLFDNIDECLAYADEIEKR